MSSRYILGIDPGFANIGYAILEVTSIGTRVLSMGVLKTKKDPALSTAEDTFARAQELHKALLDLLEKYSEVSLISTESLSFPRNASTAAKISIFWGVLAAVSHAKNIRVVQVTPKNLKKAITGNTSSSKEEIIDALNTKYGASLNPLTTKGLYEHCYDALAASIYALEEQK